MKFSSLDSLILLAVFIDAIVSVIRKVKDFGS